MPYNKLPTLICKILVGAFKLPGSRRVRDVLSTCKLKWAKLEVEGTPPGSSFSNNTLIFVPGGFSCTHSQPIQPVPEKMRLEMLDKMQIEIFDGGET